MIYYPRTLESKIKEKLHSPEAIFILGARQVGKTTLMKHLMNELPENQYIYLDLENPTFLSILNKGVNEFLAYLKYQGLSNETRNCIFIDEIQYAPDFSSIIKYMVDHYSENYKLILSGSSSLQIRKQFKDSLVGRKIIFELYPLSFEEYCCFKEENKISELLQKINPFELKEDPLRFEKEKVHYLLREYLIYGGFPKVALQENKKDKITPGSGALTLPGLSIESTLFPLNEGCRVSIFFGRSRTSLLFPNSGSIFTLYAIPLISTFALIPSYSMTRPSNFSPLTSILYVFISIQYLIFYDWCASLYYWSITKTCIRHLKF